MGKLKLRPQRQQLVKMEVLEVNAEMIPSFNIGRALDRGVTNNILLRTSGGIGDLICAEPSIRYALKHFAGNEYSLLSKHPELFGHLKFKKVYTDGDLMPPSKEFLVFKTLHDHNHLQWEYMSGMLCQAVDYISQTMFRMQLPVSDREIQFECGDLSPEIQVMLPDMPQVIVHAGRHWPSKTFPASWWNEVLKTLVAEGVKPILIGSNAAMSRGTVDVDPVNCVDLRNLTSIRDMMWLCKNASVVLSNDSSPVHLASAGRAHIHFISTCKHPDFITHWRKGIWGWRMKNHGLGGMWDLQDYCPNHAKIVDVANVDPDILMSWLPNPKSYALTAVADAFHEYLYKSK